MLFSLNDLKHYSIESEDGNIGKIIDFYFDDKEWRIRYAVVDTSKWLFGRKVIIPPQAFSVPDANKKEFPFKIKKKEIENSPSILADEPVSRQKEKDIVDYFEWPVYWGSTTMHPSQNPIVPTFLASRNIIRDKEVSGDPNLRSINEVEGYSVKANDGEIGKMEDFVVNDKEWLIKFVILNTGKWFPGKDVKIEPEEINWISWYQKTVSIDHSLDEIKDKPEFSMKNVKFR